MLVRNFIDTKVFDFPSVRRAQLRSLAVPLVPLSSQVPVTCTKGRQTKENTSTDTTVIANQLSSPSPIYQCRLHFFQQFYNSK